MYKKGRKYKREMTVVLDKAGEIVYVDEIEGVKWYLGKHDPEGTLFRTEPAIFDPEKMAYVPNRGQFQKIQDARRKFRRFK